MSKRNSQAPSWQNNAPFQFFASLQLAMILLSVLIVASIAGTIYESSLDAKVARAYIYGAAWFNVWLLLLAVNLICSALSRMPWQRHHTGFLVTHLGIVILLIGSFIGHVWGIEGTMTLFKNEPPNNLLTVDERIVQIVENERASQLIPFEFINHKPSAEHPRHLAQTPSGWSFDAIGHSTTLEARTEAEPVEKDGAPAVHINLSTQQMGQKLDRWLFADEAHGTFDLGLASVQFKKGTAPAAPVAKAEPVEIEESIFAFANSPADQIAKSLKGGSTGAKVTLREGKVTVALNDHEQTYEVEPVIGQERPFENTPYRVKFEQYWPDFRIKDGKPSTASDQPNNPCVLVTLRGVGVPVAAPAGGATGGNFVTIYTGDDGALTYQLSSRKFGLKTGRLEAGTPLTTGWADWQLLVDRVLPQARSKFVASPAPNGKSEGILIRAKREAKSLEMWVPFSWQVSFPAEVAPIQIGYGLRQQPLPISLELLEFEVERNEGTDAPAGFKSTVQITGMDGRSVTGQCWMNNPISHPASWLNTFSGLTYKISQASWNPENLSQSSVQILRDPGWGLKWIGSLLVVMGVFSLFYLRPYPKDLQPMPEPAAPAKVEERSRETIEV